MTGIEPLLGPALAKAAGTGTAKATLSAGGALVQARRRRKVRALLRTGSLSRELRELEQLNPAQISDLVRFCESTDIEQIAASLSRAYLLEGNSRKSSELEEAVRAELRERVAIHIGADRIDEICSVLFAALTELVLANARVAAAGDKTSPALHAQLVKTAGSLAAASLRNAELLRGLNGLDEINKFVCEMREQVVALRGSMRLPHAGTSRQVPYERLYVQPRLSVSTREVNGQVRAADEDLLFDETRRRRSASIDSILQRFGRVVVLGDPGGGKSTLSEKLIFDIASSSGEAAIVPFLVVIRDYAKQLKGANKKISIIEHLEQNCKFPFGITAPSKSIEYLLLNDRAVVVFDGLDELLDTSLRREVVQAVESFAHRYPACPILVTSRRIGYLDAPLDADLFALVQLGEFTEENVKTYATNWFRLDEGIPPERRTLLANTFMADSQFVPDLRANPLLLSLMCGIYATENYIPANRPDVYEKCSLLLFERWDKQRGIKPDLPFDAHVQAAMRSLALYMYRHQGEEGIHRTRLTEYMTEYLLERRFDNEESAENAAVEFIDFCKGRAWVLTDIGADTYGFTHRTFLEYFAASQLVRQNPGAQPLFDTLREYIATGSWDVVAQLALQIVGRNVEDASDQFLELLLSEYHSRKKFDRAVYNIFSFVVRSLEFVVPKPALLEDICKVSVELFFSGGSAAVETLKSPLAALSQVSVENQGRVGDVLRDILAERFQTGDDLVQVAQAAFLVMLNGESGPSGAYWEKWSLENLALFEAYAKPLSRKLWWLAVLLYEQGMVSLSRVLKAHGLGALYRHDYPGGFLAPPFAYRLLTAERFYGSGQIPGLVGAIGRGRVRQIKNDLDKNLTELIGSRFRYRKMHVSLAQNLYGFGRHGHRVAKLGGRPYEVILCLPVIEIVASGKTDVESLLGDDDNSDLRLLTLVRLGRENVDCLPQRMFDCLETRPDVANLFRSWVTRNYSFVSGIGN